MLKIDLRRLILLLTVATALLTLANTFYAGYQAQRDLLMQQTLESNRSYALKLARSADSFFGMAQQQLAYSARLLPPLMARPAPLAAEADRLKRQTGSFNSVFIVRADGRVLATSPDTLGMVGRLLESAGARTALSQRRPLISPPYVSSTGRLVVFISQPVFGPDGTYLGYVGGSIYLQERNALHALLGDHYYRDGSYLYVVDRQLRLIYHQNARRVGEVVRGNPVIDAVTHGRPGSQRLTNSQGVDMLAGYAPVQATGWGVVAQRPTVITLKELDGLMLETLRNAIPVSLLTLLGIWWMSRLISRPLRRLADTAEHWDSPVASGQIEQVKSWYFEADQLKRAMLTGVALLHQKLGLLRLENMTDPLTELHNRRGMNAALAQWQAGQQPFAVIALDIDHFKQVNDRFGHDVGDRVLQHLAQLMRANSRDGDVLCRSGGEEFFMLLPGAGPTVAGQVAERLRAQLAAAANPTGAGLTVSAGVAHWPAGPEPVEAVLKRADEALYAAKRAGRNRVVEAGSDV